MNLDELKSTLIVYLQAAMQDTQCTEEQIKIERVITTFRNLKPTMSFKVIKLTVECAFDLILTCSKPCNLKDLLNEYKKHILEQHHKQSYLSLLKNYFSKKNYYI